MNALKTLRESLQARATVRSHIWQSAANYTQQGFGLVLGVVLARLLTPADFGAYAYAAAITVLSLLPATWSLAPTLVADAGRTPALHRTIAQFTWIIVSARVVIVAGIVTYFLVVGRPREAVLCFMVGFTEGFRELNNIQKGLLEGRGEFAPNFVSVAVNVFFCIIVVVPLAIVAGGPYVLVLPGLGIVITDMFIYRYYSGRSVFVKPAWAVPTEYFQNGFWIWLGAVSEVGLSRFDKWFLGKFRTETELGYYNRAFGYAPIAFLALNSFATNPTVSGLARCVTAEARLRLFLKTAAVLLIGGLLNWILFFPLARPIILTVFGPKWEATIPVFRAFASLSFAYAVAYLPITVMLAQRRFRALGVTRAAMLLVFVVTLLCFHKSASGVFVAWILQTVLVSQGIILLFLCRSAFTHQSNTEARNGKL